MAIVILLGTSCLMITYTSTTTELTISIYFLNKTFFPLIAESLVWKITEY